MSLLLKVIFASHARSTHHKLALDALKHLRGADSDRWANLLISQHAAYLDGAKAPDDDFKDFKNHVLHVREKFWGGAVASTEHWYGQFIDHLRGAEWKEAAYAAGVLSHYYSDPHMPFHTAQSEAEGAVHRAAEWSVTKSYELLRDMTEQQLGGYPDVRVSTTDDWLAEMVRAGAMLANPYYELLIDHYDLSVGVKDPPAGLDQVAREAVARCLAHATVGFSRILDRAFAESAVSPPQVTLSMQAVLATVNVPIRQVVNKLADAKDRQAVEAIYREVQETGKAVHSLPESEKLVRQFHAAEVLKVPMHVLDAEKPRPAGLKFVPIGKQKNLPDPRETASLHNVRPEVTKPASAIVPAQIAAIPAAMAAIPAATEPDVKARPQPLLPVSVAQPAVEKSPVQVKEPEAAVPQSLVAVSKDVTTPRFYLTVDAPIVDAPSIGPKTATRFHAIGMQTIGDLLKADPVETARRLETRHITVDVLRDWQAQSNLMVTVAGLRGHDAQLLVAADVRDRTALCNRNADELLQAVTSIASTSQGRSILRDGSPPDLAEVTSWIASADDAAAARLLRAG